MPNSRGLYADEELSFATESSEIECGKSCDSRAELDVSLDFLRSLNLIRRAKFVLP